MQIEPNCMTSDTYHIVEFGAGVDQFLTRCELSCLMQEFIGSYIMMEEYFMRMMVIKVFWLILLFMDESL